MNKLWEENNLSRLVVMANKLFCSKVKKDIRLGNVKKLCLYINT